MHILLLPVIEQQAAVGVAPAQVDSVLPKKIGNDVPAQLPQIPGEDQVIVLGGGVGLPKHRREGVIGRRRHSRPHVVGVLDAQVHNASAGDMGDIGAVSPTGEDAASGGGGRPLGSGGTLVAVEHGHTVLTLGGTEMGAGHGGHDGGKAAVDEQCRQGQALAHGGAGAVESVEGDFEVPKAKGGADALVQQVSGQDAVHLLGGNASLFHCPAQGELLHGGFALFPAFLAEVSVGIQLVEISGQGTSGLLLTADIGEGQDADRVGKRHRLAA